jgi:hypothetical protein
MRNDVDNNLPDQAVVVNMSPMTMKCEILEKKQSKRESNYQMNEVE